MHLSNQKTRDDQELKLVVISGFIMNKDNDRREVNNVLFKDGNVLPGVINVPREEVNVQPGVINVSRGGVNVQPGVINVLPKEFNVLPNVINVLLFENTFL